MRLRIVSLDTVWTYDFGGGRVDWNRAKRVFKGVHINAVTSIAGAVAWRPRHRWDDPPVKATTRGGECTIACIWAHTRPTLPPTPARSGEKAKIHRHSATTALLGTHTLVRRSLTHDRQQNAKHNNAPR